MSRYPNGVLVLEEGSHFYGRKIGSDFPIQGEVCFTTGMTGYQEAITDPSYARQIVVFSFPHIGNAGSNEQDEESSFVQLSGIIIGSDPTPPTNWRHTSSFSDWLTQKRISGLSYVNTRRLVRIIRDFKMPLKGILAEVDYPADSRTLEKLAKQAKRTPSLSGSNLAFISSSKEPQLFSSLHSSARRIAVIDLGIKQAIIDAFIRRNYAVMLFPAESSVKEIMQFDPDGILLSNGPGDPRECISKMKTLLSPLLESPLPMMGICLGYQVLALLHGAKVHQMACGHHGQTHPVIDLATNRIMITSQNHEFVVEKTSLPRELLPSHISLFDASLEGFVHRDHSVFGIQFHPEASPGPQEAEHCFDRFIQQMGEYAEKR